ncbi:MAG: GTPase [Saccharofermentans sp.]|nr:GTPase [Saccharofermentans sp.]
MMIPYIPVYLFSGFLDSGKTSLIKEFLNGLQNKTPCRILLICCEQGEEEYDYDELYENGIILKYIEDECLFTHDNILGLIRETSADKVVVEYNGMWKASLPYSVWEKDQLMETLVIDTDTFEVYLSNLKAIIADKIRTADLVIFGRCNADEDKIAYYRRSVKALNSNANIVFRNDNGDVNIDYVSFLPYDYTEDHIDVTDGVFAAFYTDASENPDRYRGKTVSFTVMVLNPGKDKKGSFIAGRLALTCCSEDLSAFGFIFDADDDFEPELKDWFRITAEMEVEHSEKYDIDHPVCKVIDMQKCDAPAREVVGV